MALHTETTPGALPLGQRIDLWNCTQQSCRKPPPLGQGIDLWHWTQENCRKSPPLGQKLTCGTGNRIPVGSVLHSISFCRQTLRHFVTRNQGQTVAESHDRTSEESPLNRRPKNTDAHKRALLSLLSPCLQRKAHETKACGKQQHNNCKDNRGRGHRLDNNGCKCSHQKLMS